MGRLVHMTYRDVDNCYKSVYSGVLDLVGLTVDIFDSAEGLEHTSPWPLHMFRKRGFQAALVCFVQSAQGRRSPRLSCCLLIWGRLW
jgi:hypothetical protein